MLIPTLQWTIQSNINCWYVLRPALPEKPILLEIIQNDLCSYSVSDISRVSYFNPHYAITEGFLKLSISLDKKTLYRCLSGQLSRFFIFQVVPGFWSYQKFVLNLLHNIDLACHKSAKSTFSKIALCVLIYVKRGTKLYSLVVWDIYLKGSTGHVTMVTTDGYLYRNKSQFTVS